VELVNKAKALSKIACMYLGIEIGGTKLQLGVGTADCRQLTALKRANIRPENGAEGIRQQIRQIALPLISDDQIKTIGIGFGGPVDLASGTIVKSHHVSGWDGFALVEWCRHTLGIPACLANDSDMAGLAEARVGAGRGKRVVFYSNVGSGIGGAFCVDGRVYIGGAGIASELGHLSPSLEPNGVAETVESAASGWAIAKAARSDPALSAELQRLHGCTAEQVTGRMVAQSAQAGNPSAVAIFYRATQTYGWALAQMITLLSPEVIVVGGGVPQAGDALFFSPLRQQVERCAFPPLRGTYQIIPAELGEEVVVHGALILAKELAEHGNAAGLFIP
jgi:glucokinase